MLRNYIISEVSFCARMVAKMTAWFKTTNGRLWRRCAQLSYRSNTEAIQNYVSVLQWRCVLAANCRVYMKRTNNNFRQTLKPHSAYMVGPCLFQTNLYASIWADPKDKVQWSKVFVFIIYFEKQVNYRMFLFLCIYTPAEFCSSTVCRTRWIMLADCEKYVM